MPHRILHLAVNEVLRRPRHLLLEGLGYEVISPTDMREIETACASGSGFDAAVIGFGFPVRIQAAILGILRERCPGLPVIQLTQNETNEADLIVSNHPAEVVKVLKEILANR